MRHLPLILAAIWIAALFSVRSVVAAPTTEMTLVGEYWFSHGSSTDASGADCLSDEDIWTRTWRADRFTGTFTASVYLCPFNPNAPSGSNNYSLWASFVSNGAASLTLTYPNGTVVPARFNPATSWTEVCVLDPFSIPAGVYTLTFVGAPARKPIVHLDTDFAESVRGQYWWGCDPSWGPR